jgi:hypothetical protein
MDESDLGEESAVAQVIDNDIHHFGSNGFKKIPEQIVRHRSGGLNLFQLKCNSLGFEGSYNDRQSPVSVNFPQYQCIGTATGRTR